LRRSFGALRSLDCDCPHTGRPWNSVAAQTGKLDMRISTIVQLGLKELRGLSRDPALLILIVYAFTLSIYTSSRAQPETLNRAALAIVDEDNSPVSTRIITAFNPPFFSIPKLVSQADVMVRLDAGLDVFALNIPPNFQRDLLAGRSPAIQLN